jgi:hypothetical protein
MRRLGELLGAPACKPTRVTTGEQKPDASNGNIPGRDYKPVKDNFIAVLKDEGDVDGAADEIVKCNGKVKHKYNSALKGFAFELPPQASDQAKAQMLEKLKKRADLDYLMQDFMVEALGTTCK